MNRLITVKEVEDILNYFENIGDNNERLKIKDLTKYQTAFVHKSFFQCVNSETTINYIPEESNQRLEFLGDSILKGVIGKYLYKRFPNEKEGFLTKIKIKLEKTSMLHKFARELNFKKYLLLSLKIENQTLIENDRGRNTPSYYEDAFEAFVGSIFDDFGEYGTIYADRFVISIIENTVDFSELISVNDNFKDSLQRYFQMCNFKNPIYIYLPENSKNKKVFSALMLITEQELNTFDSIVQTKIKDYTKIIKNEYLKNYKDIDLEKIISNKIILGLGHGRKIINADQDCASICLDNLNLSKNF